MGAVDAVLKLTDGAGLPVPVTDELNRPFWDAAREGRLVTPRCAECRRGMAPPVANCSGCLGTRFEWVTTSGRGTLYSFIEYHRSWIREYDARLPYIVAIVELDAGPRMLTLLVGETSDWVTIGARVRVAFQTRGDGMRVPVFERDPAGAPAAVPRYDQLAVIEKTGARHAWGVFGANDELGTLNFITPEVVAAATGEVTAGEVINLSLPLDQPDPPLVPGRKQLTHRMRVERWGRDDWLESLYLQASSQWDGLRHIRYREFGYYGGRDDAAVDAGALGIDRIARHGVVGRGVLVDAAGYLAAQGRPIDASVRFPIGPELIEEILDWQHVRLRAGDILLLRTGWMAWYLGLERDGRERLAGALHNAPDGLDCPGLAAGEASAAWLWNHRVAAIAADNPALEVLKVDPHVGFLHRLLIPLLGMPIGEFWDLEALSDACRRRQRYAFLLTSAPLFLRGGVGSPSNAYAVL